MSDRSHTITALVENDHGTLNRLVSLFRRRSFSLASLNAGDCEEEGLSRVTIVVNGDDGILRQCVRQLDKLLDVVEVDDVSPDESIQRELALVRVFAESSRHAEIASFAQLNGARVAHRSDSSITVEACATPAAIDRLVSDLHPFGERQVVRSGLVAIRVEDKS